jgi:hypothetical protein
MGIGISSVLRRGASSPSSGGLGMLPIMMCRCPEITMETERQIGRCGVLERDIGISSVLRRGALQRPSGVRDMLLIMTNQSAKS